MSKRWCKFIIVYLLIWAAVVGAARPKGVRTGDTQIQSILHKRVASERTTAYRGVHGGQEDAA